jgi:acyl-coenzyme A thioesterase PaaI-like protein
MSGDRSAAGTGRPHRRFRAGTLRRLLSLYPPFLFQRIRVISISDDFRRSTVRVSPSLLNRNLNGTIFGGTIFSAADPMYAVMLWQLLARRESNARVWLRRGRVRYVAPAASALTLRFELSEQDLEAVLGGLGQHGRYDARFTTEAVDARGGVCAVIETEVAVRVREAGDGPSGF